MLVLTIPYANKFTRDVILAVFAGDLSSMKIKSSKNFKQSQCIWSSRVDNKGPKTVKFLDFDRLQKLHPSKICMYTVIFLH